MTTIITDKIHTQKEITVQEEKIVNLQKQNNENAKNIKTHKNAIKDVEKLENHEPQVSALNEQIHELQLQIRQNKNQIAIHKRNIVFFKKHKIANDGFRRYCIECGENADNC